MSACTDGASKYAVAPAADLRIVSYCPHCGCEISSERLAEYGGCYRCGTLRGWSDSLD